MANILANPDNDGLKNLVEYALRKVPNSKDSGAFPQPVVADAGGHPNISIDIRDDDPSLMVVAEVSDTPDFTVIDQIIAVETDPDANDGFKTSLLPTPKLSTAGTNASCDYDPV